VYVQLAINITMDRLHGRWKQYVYQQVSQKWQVQNMEQENNKLITESLSVNKNKKQKLCYYWGLLSKE
jgi:hypothetical protein